MTQRANLTRLVTGGPMILPSLLLCDFGNLEREVRRLEEAGIRALHLDVMDGVFVPNMTYGMTIVSAIRRLTDLPLDVHLMIVQPQRYLRQFRDAGADVITVHVEAVDDPRAILADIRALDAGAGIALNPGTPLERVESCLELCDLALVMSVEAGFGRQAFDERALARLQRLQALTGGRVMLEVDGGVNASTIQRIAAAGARYFVVGSAIFGKPEYGPVVRQLEERAGIQRI